MTLYRGTICDGLFLLVLQVATDATPNVIELSRGATDLYQQVHTCRYVIIGLVRPNCSSVDSATPEHHIAGSWGNT